jgi:hypothetical protein
MLIKVTNQCAMKCKHCMENSLPNTGQHMSMETFKKAFALSQRLEVYAPFYKFILFSGGECSENPELPAMMDYVLEAGWHVQLITNGTWLRDPALRNSIMAPHRMQFFKDKRIFIQVSNDPEFYPTPVVVSPRWQRMMNISIASRLIKLLPLGRWTEAKNATIPPLDAPSSFNFRSATRHQGDVRLAIKYLRLRTLEGRGGHCSPNIDHKGILRAGESNACAEVGTVDSTVEEVTHNVINMGECNRCTLEKKLPVPYREALGLK